MSSKHASQHRLQPPRLCLTCGKEFIPYTKQHKFCSPKCHSKDYLPKYHKHQVQHTSPDGIIRLMAYDAHIRERLREEVFQHYGNKCVCCGEKNPLFLTLDHINNDGGEQKRKLGSQGKGVNFYGWARKVGYPEDLQLLCFNCNCGKGRNKGICPHKGIG